MIEILLIVALGLLLGVGILQIILLRRKFALDLTPIQQALQSVEKSSERIERTVREEIANNRDEASKAAAQSRDELGKTLKGVGDTLNLNLDRMGKTVEGRLQLIQDDGTKKLDQVRNDSLTSAKNLREEVGSNLKNVSESIGSSLGQMGQLQKNQLGVFSDRLEVLTGAIEKKLDGLKTAVEKKLESIQTDNATQLEKMRQTVDEKLQGTLEKRLGESFKQVSDQLEQVYKGLGEMQTLATGVGDLKRVLSNVKTRGTWGEVQLGAMLEQVLTTDQFAVNVATKDGGERVEFAIKLPGRGDAGDEVVWLPIDAKWPNEDYQRLIDAQEKGDLEAAEAAVKQLEISVKSYAATISSKYLNPPKTTDFGILFLPTEGLFAEVIRRAGLADFVQRESRVVIAGPTTLWSILNSLQMGFRTLAIQERSSEVWKTLAAVKTEWTRYGEVLAKVQKKLQEASNTVDAAASRARVIGRKLKDVQALPANEAQAVLMIENSESENEQDGELPES